jgi:hypothetical protein
MMWHAWQNLWLQNFYRIMQGMPDGWAVDNGLLASTGSCRRLAVWAHWVRSQLHNMSGIKQCAVCLCQHNGGTITQSL